MSFEQPRLPVATTALRALSVVQNSLGEQAMLSVYDRAIELRPGRAIVEPTVKTATRELLSPAPPPLPGPSADDIEDHEPPDDLPDEDELPEEVSTLVDRLDVLRRHVDDLRLSIEDPVLAHRALRNIEEELAEVRAAMPAAYGQTTRPA